MADRPHRPRRASSRLIVFNVFVVSIFFTLSSLIGIQVQLKHAVTMAPGDVTDDQPTIMMKTKKLPGRNIEMGRNDDDDDISAVDSSSEFQEEEGSADARSSTFEYVSDLNAFGTTRQETGNTSVAQNVDRGVPTIPITPSQNVSVPLLNPWKWKALAEMRSSVNYFATAGLGHRLVRQSDASSLAKEEGFVLRPHWGFCEVPETVSKSGFVEIFNHFFEPVLIETVLSVDSDLIRNTKESDVSKRLLTNVSLGKYITVSNEVPGFAHFSREGNQSECWCTAKKNREDYEFYQDIRRRFRLRNRVKQFYQRNFDRDQGALVIGLHIRAGNGEGGDFSIKKRGIPDPDAYVRTLVKSLIRLHRDVTSDVAGRKQTDVFSVFLATDTPSMINKLREALSPYSVSVVTYDQLRVGEGNGVPIIEGGGVCLDNWEGAIMDMMLVGEADIVVSARPSSLTQSLPMTMKLETPVSERRRNIKRNYCEFEPSGQDYRCYTDTMDWCCNGKSSFHLVGNMPDEIRRMAKPGPKNKRYKILERSKDRKLRSIVPCVQDTCLVPQYWPQKLTNRSDLLWNAT